MSLNDRVESFLTDDIQRWAVKVQDHRHGGFFDRLDCHGEPVTEDPKTTLVQARSLFTMAHLELMGYGSTSIRDAAHSARDFLLGPLRHPDGGFCKAVARNADRDRPEADAKRDCYDHAFVVLALATWMRIEPSIQCELEAVWSAVERLFMESDTGGLLEDDGKPPSLPRRQNPHMHMFEACLFAWEASDATVWHERADRLLNVFQRRLFDESTGTLREFLNEDLGPLEDAEGMIREPGHHYEWVWLIHRYKMLGGKQTMDRQSEALMRFALDNGHAKSGPMKGAVLDELDTEGSAVTRTHLLWPQTEAIKAHLSEYERTGDKGHRDTARNLAALMFEHYIDQEQAIWINQRDASGAVVWDECLTRLVYHIVVALSEGGRLGAWRN